MIKFFYFIKEEYEDIYCGQNNVTREFFTFQVTPTKHKSKLVALHFKLEITGHCVGFTINRPC